MGREIGTVQRIMSAGIAGVSGTISSGIRIA